MKEALSDFQGGKVKKSNGKKKIDIRDFWWEYPSFVFKVFKRSIPFSYILLFLAVGVTLASFLQSDAVARILEDSKASETFTEGSVGAI